MIKRRHRILRVFTRMLLALIIGLACFVVIAVLWFFANAGEKIAAPDWVRQQISKKISAQLPELTVEFDDLSVIVPESPFLHLEVSSVQVSLADGAPVVAMSEVETTLSLQALWEGLLQPTYMRFSGSGLVLRREPDGAITLSGNKIGGIGRPVDNFVELFEVLDTILERPNLARLTAVDADNLSMRYEDAKADKAWSADGGTIRLERDGEEFYLTTNVVLLGDRAYATEVAANYSGVIGSAEGSYGFKLTDMPSLDLVGQSLALDWLSVIDAPISGALRGAINPDKSLGLLNATLNIDAGVVHVSDQVPEAQFDKARVYFSFNPVTERMVIDELSLDSQWVQAKAEGTAQLAANAQGKLSGMLTQLRLIDLSIQPSRFYKTPLQIEQADIVSRLAFEPFNIELGEVLLKTNGQNIRLKGNVAETKDGWQADLQAQAGQVTPETVVRLWPVGIKEKLRLWIKERIQAGMVENASAAIRIRPGVKPDVAIDFSFVDLDLEYVRGMPVLTKGRGQASLYKNRFAAVATGGVVHTDQGGATDLTGTSFVIPDTRIKKGPAEVHFSAQGPIVSGLSIIDSEPLSLLKKAGKKPTLATGYADVKGIVNLKLKKPLPKDEISVEFSGVLSDVFSDTLAEGREIRAERLNIAMADKVFSVDGKATINALPADFSWRQRYVPEKKGHSRLKADVILSEAGLEKFGIRLPKGLLSGSGSGQVELDLRPEGKGSFHLTSNLRGIGLNLPQVGWSLSRQATARLSIKGSLGKLPVVENLRLDARGLSVEGGIRFKPNNELDVASFRQFKVGDWLNVPADLVGQGRDNPLLVKINGGFLDLRKARFGGGSSDGQRTQNKQSGGTVQVALDKLQVADTLVLTKVKTVLDVAGGASGSFTGLVNGKAPVRGVIKPHSGRSSIYVESDNAGAVASAAGLVKNARAGNMKLSLTPASSKGIFNGALEIHDISVRDAPTLAALLNSLSIVGLVNELAGDGIYFDDMIAKFQLSPEQLTITEASAVGSSIGISLDGYYYPKSKRIDVQGVVSPIYLLNQVGQIFTRRGEGLLGFNYTLSGPTSSPSVGVNPLSLFTPGMFRELFRRAPPEVQQ